jgi:polar amino acid transport system substrate-binding protein
MSTVKQILIYLLFLYLPVTCFAQNKTEDPIFYINTPLHPPTATTKHDGFEDLLAIELFNRLGFKKITIHNVPAERGLINLNNGIDDAILTRVAGLEAIYPNIVRITEPANVRKYTAFTRTPERIKTWDDLENYDVAYITGWKIFDKNVKKYRSLIKVRGPEQLFTLLEKKRVEVVLYAHEAGNYLVKKLKLTDIKPLEEPLANKQKYFYLHKRHAQLVPKANAVLRQLKKDGIYDELKRQTLQSHQ